MTKPKVLVTGGGGFVGRHLLTELDASQYEIHVITRRALTHAPAGVIQHQADLMDAPAMAAVVGGIGASHLVHLAWDVTPGKFWQDRGNLDWVAASLLLYRAFAAAGGRRIVSTGTCAEYDWSYPLLDEAETPARPGTLYGIAKHALHQILSMAALRDGIELAWARLFFLYGPYESPSRLVPDVAVSLLRGQPVACGDGTGLRDFMHVQDGARALATVLASDYVGAVNIASGRCVPLRDIIRIVAESAGRPDLVRLGERPTPAGEPPRLEAGMAILRDRLKFRPLFTNESGLASVVEWWRIQDGAT